MADQTERYDVLIVGGGHGGAHAASALRQRGFAGSIAIVTEEADPPYERPPLSKEYLSGEKAFDRLLIRPLEFWATREIALLLSRQIVAVDAVAHTVTDARGCVMGYDTLIWATGGHARALSCSGHDLAGVHAIRTRADVDRLFGELGDTSRVAVVGGGYIGLEAAAALSKRGLPVTVLEAQERVLARVAGNALSSFFEAEHRAHGVDLRLATTVAQIEGSAGRASGVRLSDGGLVEADIVIVGIGIVPAVGPLLDAGAEGGNGVLVDACCQTSLPDIYAIGDCALHRSGFAEGAPIRLESVQNAVDMATTAVLAILGMPEPYAAVPWFWSNQYDLKLQTVGLSSGHDREVLRGDPTNRSFSIVYLKQGRVVALDCVNLVRDYVQGRALVLAGTTPDISMLADITVPLKTLIN